MSKELKSEWTYSRIPLCFKKEEISHIVNKVKNKKLVRIICSEIKLWDKEKNKLGKEFGKVYTLYDMNLYMKSIKIIENKYDYRLNTYYIELENRDKNNQIFYCTLEFLDTLFFQIIDEDFINRNLDQCIRD